MANADGPTVSGDNKRVYIGKQAGGAGYAISGGRPKLRAFDVSQTPIKFLGDVDGAGHSTDLFTVGGREYVLHANEGGSGGIGANLGAGPNGGDPCKPHPRYHALGWAFDALISDVTDPANARNVAAVDRDQRAGELRGAQGIGQGPERRLSPDRQPNEREVRGGELRFGGAADLRHSQAGGAGRGGLFQPRADGPRRRRPLRRRARADLRGGRTGFWVLELEPQVRQSLGL